jgi:predicted nucleic acid-binding protein
MVQSDAARQLFTLDTNILVYSADRAAGERHALAIDIVARSARVGGVLTLQSLSEFYVVSTRKSMVERSRAAALVDSWLVAFPCVAVSANAVRLAVADAVAGRASYWDALLVATAAEAGCAAILTEDMANGTTLGGVEIHNPFASGGGLAVQARRLLGL